MKEAFYTTHEISKFCNVYPTTVINWISKGILAAFTTPGGHRRVKESDLLIFLKKNDMPIPGNLSRKKSARILVVDDDPKLLKMTRTILESEKDLEVVTAKNGFEAGAIVFSERTPDVILLDILMPELDGFEVCRRIRHKKETRDIPIIAVTVLKSEKEIKKMFDSGVTDHLAKPFKSKELIEKVRKHIHV